STVEIFAFWFFFCWAASYMGLFHAANVAHGAGWFFGALYGAALYAPNHRGWYRLAAVGLSALVLATLLGVPGHPLYRQHRAAEELRRQLQTRQTSAKHSLEFTLPPSVFYPRNVTSGPLPYGGGSGEFPPEVQRNTG
ncbi:MAG TPA: hypothetical protein PLQ00_14085, partial [Thermoguttaceae bacterium]|nr:hypothetical protein [Thermoguttaceae bacterium]